MEKAGQVIIELERYDTEKNDCALSELLMKATSDVILLVTADGRIVGANQAASNTYGHAHEELLGMTIYQLREPSTRGAVRRQLQQAVEQGIAFETVHRRKDGSTFIAEVCSRAGIIGEKRIVVSIIRDITLRKKNESTLRRTNRALKTLAGITQAIVRNKEEQALLQDVCQILVAEGEYQLAWAGMVDDKERITPVAFSGETVGYSISPQITWEDMEYWQNLLDRALEKKAPVVFDRLRPGEGVGCMTECSVQAGCEPVVLLPVVVGGVSVALLVLYGMPNEMFDSEEITLLTRLADNVSYAVFALRTHAAAKTARDLNRLARLDLVGQMAASIGHEVRNPMTTVRGFLQMLSAKDTNVTNREYYRLMLDELGRANHIISEFLFLARNKRTRKIRTTLNVIIQALEPLMQAEAAKLGHKIVYEVQEIPNLLLDESEMRHLILNLIKNGLEAMAQPGTVRVRTFVKNNTVCMEIVDQGGKIPGTVLEKLGTPFFTTKDCGTGLGLAICYSIAFRHNAVLDIKPSAAGTTVRVVFPACDCTG